MLPGREAQGAFKVLMTRWLCNSHDVSHFAAFFIVIGAKTSVAESVWLLVLRFVDFRHTKFGIAVLGSIKVFVYNK